MRSIRFVGLTLVLVGLVASACGGTTPGGGASAAPSQATVTKDLLIGFTASQTGAQNVTSKRQTDGIQLWVDDVTKVGGIKLKDGTVFMPELKFYDDESKTDRVQALYTKLINDDKVDFLLSPYSSGLVKAAAVVTEQNGRLMITAGGADAVTMERGVRADVQGHRRRRAVHHRPEPMGAGGEVQRRRGEGRERALLRPDAEGVHGPLRREVQLAALLPVGRRLRGRARAAKGPRGRG